MTLARPARPETEVVFDPSTYVDGVPFEALRRLRRQAPVVRVAEIPVLGWPEGPGFWLVLRHAVFPLASVAQNPLHRATRIGVVAASAARPYRVAQLPGQGCVILCDAP